MINDKNQQSKNIFFIIYFFTLISVAVINFSVAISSIAMGAAIFFSIIYLLQGKYFTKIKTKLDVYFLAYLIVEIISTIFSVEPAHSVLNVKRIILISIVYLMMLSMMNEAYLRRALIIVVICASLVSFAELFSLKWVDGHLARLSQFQYFTTEGGIKMFFILLVFPFLVHNLTPLKYKIYFSIALIPLIVALVLTQTRSSWLGLIGGIITIGFFQKKIIILFIIVLLIIFLFFAPSDLRSRAYSIIDPTMTSNLTRIHMISTGWKMFLDRPFVGWGDIDLKKYYITYTKPIDNAEGGHLHNNFMMLLVTLGIVGFLTVMALFIKILLIELQVRKFTRENWFYGSLSLGCLAAYAGFHINGLFEWNFGDHEIAVILWFTVGIALTIEKLFQQNIKV